MTFILGTIYLLVICAGIGSMTLLWFCGKPVLCNRIFLLCQGMAVIWCSAQILALLAGTREEWIIAYSIGNAGVCMLGSLWYYFSMLYAKKAFRPWGKYIPIALSLFHYGMYVSNKWHHLYYRQFRQEHLVHGPFFYTNVLVTYLFVITGSVILYRDFKEKSGGKQGKQLVILSVLVPVLLNALYLCGLLPTEFDVTPLGFGISIILVLIAIMKFQFLEQDRELAAANEKILLEKERNRIAQQVHDTAGHTLTMLQSYMKLAMVASEEGKHTQVQEYLSEARKLASAGLKELRYSINCMRREEDCELVTQGIVLLADQVKEIPVELTIQGEDAGRYSHLSSVCYACVREAITNTLKYAQASRIEIVLRFMENGVELVFGDDGKGCDVLEDNNGLRGMRDKVAKAGGQIRIVTSKGQGFLIRISLPL